MVKYSKARKTKDGGEDAGRVDISEFIEVSPHQLTHAHKARPGLRFWFGEILEDRSLALFFLLGAPLHLIPEPDPAAFALRGRVI